MKATDLIDNESLRDDIPDFAPGDEVKVHVRVVEGNKERVQVFQGNVIGRQGSGLQETYTVRKLSYGVGVERTFPLHTPTVHEDRGRQARRRPPGEAVLPARPHRQGRQDPREARLLIAGRQRGGHLHARQNPPARRSARGSPVGVDEHAVQRQRPPLRPPAHRTGPVDAGAARAAADPCRPPSCQASSVGGRPAQDLDRRDGVDEVVVVAVVAPEVLAPQPQPGVAGEHPGPVAEAAGVARLALVAVARRSRRSDSSESFVHERQVEVVAADHHPDVVDDADLGVHVDRPARRRLEVEDRHPVAAGRAQHARWRAAGRCGRAGRTAGRPGRGTGARRRRGAARGSARSGRRGARRPRPTTGTGPRRRRAAGPAGTP